MSAAVVSAAVLLVLGLVGGGVHGVAPLLVPPVLGVIGAGAAMLTRSLDVGTRVVWMLSSGVVGFLAIWLLYVMVMIVGGP